MVKRRVLVAIVVMAVIAVDAMGASDPASSGLRYFRENVRHGITTFQDADITAALSPTRGFTSSPATKTRLFGAAPLSCSTSARGERSRWEG